MAHIPTRSGNRFEHNSMHGNGTLGAGADARDFRPARERHAPDWIDNDCDTDIPAGMLCGVG